MSARKPRLAKPSSIMPGFVHPVQPQPDPVHDTPVRVALYDGWDRLNGAIQRISVAQPFQMTAAAAELDEARRAFDRAMRNLMVERPVPAPSSEQRLALDGGAA